MANISPLMTSNRNDWETPQKLFDELNEEFNFTLDPCSSHKNAKCKKHYTIEEDGLKQTWTSEVVFCNPPYGREIGKWVKKAYDEWKHHGATVVMLIPARTDTTYFHEYIYKRAELRFVKGRIKFEINGDNFGGCSTFPSMIVVFRNAKFYDTENEFCSRGEQEV